MGSGNDLLGLHVMKSEHSQSAAKGQIHLGMSRSTQSKFVWDLGVA